MKMNKQTTWIMIGLILGIAAGYAVHALSPTPEVAKNLAGYFAMLTDIFLRLIKMIIAPLIFCTLVSGLAGMSDSHSVGRIGGRTVGWFLFASITSLLIGLLFANLLAPGANVDISLPEASASSGLKTSALNLKDFIAHMVPKNIIEAMAGNEVLQIVVFSLFFGIAIAQVRRHSNAAESLVRIFEDGVPVMLKVTDFVMRFAPVGVFAAIANVIAVQGLGVLTVYGKLIGSFYIALAVLWMVLIGAGFTVMRKDIFGLVKQVRGPMLVGFSTASSEAAYPRLMEVLERFGINKKVIGLVLPLGYSFNLDGSMIYTAFASLFIAQAYNIPMTLGQQIAMLFVLMISSKGVAGVPRSALVVVAAVLPMFNLPEAGVLLVMGVDQFLDMGRTATNVLGNGIATSVVAKWENQIGTVVAEEEEEAPQTVAAQ